MKTTEEIRKIAEQSIPYNPYNNTLFPGTRQSEINGFIKGYLKALEDLRSEKEKKD
jgi:hypothetical protein